MASYSPRFVKYCLEFLRSLYNMSASQVPPEKVHYIEIFPPIGVSRVGNSLDEFYLGSEIPRKSAVPPSGFKDDTGAVKREAVRFRAYGYDAQGAIIGELNSETGYDLKWTVNVANSKGASKIFQHRYEDSTNIGLRNPDVQGNLEPAERTKLIVHATQIISGVEKISGPLEGSFFGSREEPIKIYLGELRTDSQGRLIFLGGRGDSLNVADPHVPHPMVNSNVDNQDWVDDTSDGSVELMVTHTESKQRMPLPRYKSWVICGPPKFARGARSPTTLYDLVEEVYEQNKRTKVEYEVQDPVFYHQIWDIFECTWITSWLNKFARAHGPGGLGYNFIENETKLALQPKGGSEPDIYKAERRKVFQFVRMPVISKYDEQRKSQCLDIYMPRLSGDAGDMPEISDPPRKGPVDPNHFLSLTELQYERLRKWQQGHFVTGSKEPPPETFESIPLKDQPAALTKAALEWSTGGPLCPGIEVHWTSALPDFYEFEAELAPGIKLDPPFRISSQVKPGDLISTLSVPWQSDFYLCNTHWWPSARPDDVVSEDDFNEAVKKLEHDPSKVPGALTGRHLWAGELRDTHEDGDQNKWPGCLDMVLYWPQLGFVASRPYGDAAADLPLVLVEDRPGPIPPKKDRPT